MRTLFLALVLLVSLGCEQQAAEKPAAPAQPATTAAGAPTTPSPAAAPVTVAKAAPAPAMQPAAAPQKPAAPPAKPIVMKDSALGVVTFDHAKHKVDCATCHHPSKPEKAATKPQEACRTCHTKPVQAGMKTARQAAFHDAAAKKGTCIDCHTKEAAAGKKAPTTCKQCHVKAG